MVLLQARAIALVPAFGNANGKSGRDPRLAPANGARATGGLMGDLRIRRPAIGHSTEQSGLGDSF
jgi:hypothetical protein